jgi:hypothetical protein
MQVLQFHLLKCLSSIYRNKSSSLKYPSNYSKRQAFPHPLQACGLEVGLFGFLLSLCFWMWHSLSRRTDSLSFL